jgi:4-hydroxy-3-methylbut-2-enyl diphosphate reductase
MMKVYLANPRGFCAGVNMAIESLDIALNHFGSPVYVYHEIVHNYHVVARAKRRGAVFVDSIDEVIGTMGEAPNCMILVETPEDVDRLDIGSPDKIAYLTQTTLSVDDANRVISALRRKFPQIANPPKDDICYATQNRQDAVRVLAQRVDLVLVLGSQNSSNSKRLAEIAHSLGPHAHLIDGVEEIEPAWLKQVNSVLVTAGASAPEDVVQEVLEYLRVKHHAEIVEETVREEDVHFPLPKSLRELVPVDAISGP